MTSSFGNVIGTPRDQLPDISKTNYLETEPDLTEAVNEQIDRNIEDTKRFYDDMIEIEKNKAEAFDKRLTAIRQLTGSVAKINQALEAQRASDDLDKIQFANDAESINKILELHKEENKQDFFLMEMEGLVKDTFDRTGGKVDIRANSDAAYQTLSDIEFAFNRDQPMRLELKKIDPNIIEGGIDALLGALGFDDISDPLEKSRIRKAAEQAVRNKIHVSMLNAGYDISTGSYKKQFLKIVQPTITQYLKDRDYLWDSTFITKLEAKRKADFNGRVEDYISAINSTPAEGQDLNLFSDTEGINLIAQYKATYHPNDKDGHQKSMIWFADTVANLVKNNPKMIPHAEAVLEKLRYSDRSTKTDYLNVKEYLNSIDFEKEPKRYNNMSQFVKTIEDAISDARNTESTEKKESYKDLVAEFKKAKFDPLMEKVNKRPNRTVTRLEAFEILTEFVSDESLYNPNNPDMPIPEYINNLFNKVDVAGMDVGVAKRLEFASLINDKSSVIKAMILERKVKQGGANKLEVPDLFLAKRLEEILAAEIVEGTTGPVSQLDIEIRNAGSVESFINGRIEEIRAKFNAGEYDGLGQVLINDGAEKAEVLRQAYNKDPSLLFSKDVHDGEGIHLERALLYIRSGGKLHPEVLKYFETFRFSKLEDAEGNPLSVHEIMFERLRATGAFEDDPIFGKRLKKELDYVTIEEKKYMLSNGTHGVHNIITKENGKYAKQVLDNLVSIYANGEYANRRSGYNFYNTAPARNRFGTNISANKFGNFITERNIEYIAKVAQQHPDVVMGRYGITGREFLEIYNQEGFKEAFGKGQRFDDDFQDFMAIELMRYHLSRSNSIRGMEFDNKGRLVTKLSHFNKEEIEAMNVLFPKLKNMTFNQLHNLSPEISKLILKEVQKFDIKEAQEKVKQEYDKIGGDVFTP